MWSKLAVVSLIIMSTVVVDRSVAVGQLAMLYKAAKAEGRLELWSPTPPAEIRLMIKGFNKDFPGIKVNHFEIRDSDYVPRILAETGVGRGVSFDIGQGNYMASSPLIERDLIQPHPELAKIFPNIPSGALSRDGRFVTMYNLVLPVAYNTKLVNPTEVPTSWAELLSPKWGSGRIIADPRGMVFALLGLKWGEEEMINYARKIRAQKPRYVRSGSAIIKQLAAGVAPIGLGTYVHFVLQRQKDGAPVDYAKKVSPLPAISQVMYTMKGGPNPNAAKLFSGWLASRGEIFHTAFFKGSLLPGSDYSVQREAERNQVEPLVETSENFRDLASLGETVAAALAAVR